MATNRTRQTYLLIETQSKRTVANRVVRASNASALGWGLLGRSSMEPGEGLWLPGVRSLHTFGMRVAIDVLFLGAGGRCVGMREAVRPGRFLRGPSGTTDTVELTEGTLARANLFDSSKRFAFEQANCPE